VWWNCIWGVGKSSVTAKSRCCLQPARGLRRWNLDADVYGHSIPRLMGILDKRPTALDQTFIPVENHGVKVVSMEMFKQIVKIQLLIAALCCTEYWSNL
jgi:ATP-binding protein involved in chromosome partitioning